MRRPSPDTSPSAVASAIPTGGKLFEDGTLLELIESLEQPNGLALLMWDGRRYMKGRDAVHEGRAYVPVALDLGLRRALRLPASVSPNESTAELFAELFALARRFTDLSDESCTQLIGFVFASWLADCLPVPINLVLWAPVASEAARVLLLLGCLCRQGLPLSGVSARDLGLIPSELQPTLLVFRPASGRRTLEALSSRGWRGFHTALTGQFRELIGSVAISTDTPLQDRALDPVIEVAVPASKRALPVLDSRTQRELAKKFLPKLLRYRLEHYRSAIGGGPSDVDSRESSGQLAAGICACFADEPELRDRQLALLAETNESEQDARSADPRVPLIEVIWARCHEVGRSKIYVAEVAADLNAILALKERPALSCRMVGSLLKALRIGTKRLDRQGAGGSSSIQPFASRFTSWRKCTTSRLSRFPFRAVRNVRSSKLSEDKEVAHECTSRTFSEAESRLWVVLGKRGFLLIGFAI